MINEIINSQGDERTPAGLPGYAVQYIASGTQATNALLVEESDQEILSLIEIDLDKCMKVIMKLYENKIYSKCMGYLKCEVLAKDACQEILIKIFQNIKLFKGDSKLSTWIQVIAANHCVDTYRKQERYDKIFNKSATTVPVIIDDLTDSGPYNNEKMVKLYKAIYLLEEDKRDLLIDKYINNKKIKEIALERSSTESAIKMQIKRARDSAKKKYLEIHAK